MEEKIINFIKQKDYILVNDKLGSGSFGKTVLLKDPFIDELFVAKKYEPFSDDIKEKFYQNFLDEIKILHKLNHRNVVRVYNYYAYQNIYTGYIIMEYIEGVTIEQYVIDYCGVLEPCSLDEIFIQLIDGFCYIENNGIIHRDIREGNILIDNSGIVKIIDFGIGKIFNEENNCKDSLVEEINREASDTLPQEYYEGIYTSQTDMFYVAELFNRLIGRCTSNDFSYNEILSRMMKKYPNDRYESFYAVKEAIEKHDFTNMNISKEDKEIYQEFVNPIYKALSCFVNSKEFNYNIDIFISKVDKALKNNIFENIIQDNQNVIDSVVSGDYRYTHSIDIQCSDVKKFLDWFKASTVQSQELILKNIINKLSTIKIEFDLDVPF